MSLVTIGGVGFSWRPFSYSTSVAHSSGNLKEFLEDLPKMQGTHVEPGTSQFRRLWAKTVARIMSTNMMRPDFSHSRLFMLLPSPIYGGMFGKHSAFREVLGLIGIIGALAGLYESLEDDAEKMRLHLVPASASADAASLRVNDRLRHGIDDDNLAADHRNRCDVSVRMLRLALALARPGPTRAVSFTTCGMS
jgi:hypothetical protein